MVGYYWSPAPLNAVYEWQVLEEPPYTTECWQQVTSAAADDSLRPIDQACAFPDAPIDKLAHKDLSRKAPAVVDMLRKMELGLDPLNGSLAWARQNGVQDWGVAAAYYLSNNEDRWRSWVTPEAYEKIRMALDETDRSGQ